jgi:iron complex transport system substrate-binding protein
MGAGLLLPLGSCGGAESSRSSSPEAPDMAAADAHRIVSLSPSTTEILFAIGAGQRLVGRDEMSDYPPAALEVASIGSAFPKLNAEVIVARQPDLVLAAGIINPDDIGVLRDLGLNVYAAPRAAHLEDVYTDILEVGRWTGRSRAAAELVAGLKVRVEQLLPDLHAERPRRKVFYEVDATDPAKPWTAGPGSFIDELLQLAGAVNLGQVGSEDYFQMSLEVLVQEDPDLIILGSSTYGGQDAVQVHRRAGWSGIRAVRTQQIFPFDDDLVSRPGPRLVDGLEQLLALLETVERNLSESPP